MFAKLVLSAMLLPFVLPPMESISAQEPPASSVSSCLGVEHPDMKLLLESTRWWLSIDGQTADRVRARHFEGRRLPPERVQPVLEDAACAKVMTLVRERLMPGAIPASAIAVVRVDGRTYVAIFRHFASGVSRTVGTRYYLDRGLTRIIEANML